MDEMYRQWRHTIAEFAAGRNWMRLLAKRGDFEQTLFEHTLTCVEVMIQLLSILRRPEHLGIGADRNEEGILVIAAALHDSGKESSQWQEYLSDPSKGFVEHIDKDKAKRLAPELCQALGFRNLEAVVGVCTALHHKRARGSATIMDSVLDMLDGDGPERWRTLAEVVDLVDNVASAKGVFGGLRALEHSVLSSHLRFDYHQVLVRGVSTVMLHKAVLQAYEQLGWVPLLHYHDATLYVASALSNVSTPSRDQVEGHLSEVLAHATARDVAGNMVGSPTGNILPKPELFEFTEVESYLRAAANKVGKTALLKKRSADKERVVRAYYKFRGMDSPPEGTDVEHEAARMSAAYPEMIVFKFFKATMSTDLVGAEGAQIASREYEAVFGQGAWQALLSTSTLMPAKDMHSTIDRYWSLSLAQVVNALEETQRMGLAGSLDVGQKVEELADGIRTDILIAVLGSIAQLVYQQISAAPSRKALAGKMASAFIRDLVRPAHNVDIRALSREQLETYGYSKPFAGKDSKKGRYICPICNVAFVEGAKASADFLSKPESHTNRAVSHGSFGRVIICETCKYERFVRQLLLGGRPSEMVVLMPMMNLGPQAGEILLGRARQLYDRMEACMLGRGDDPNEQISLSLTGSIARKTLSIDLFQLGPTELADLFSYRVGEENRKRRRKELLNLMQGAYPSGGGLTELNDMWITSFATWDEAADAVIAGRVDDEEARGMRNDAYKLYPHIGLVCQTPHMILMPLRGRVSMEDESDSNAALRKVFIEILLGLALECSVAIISDDEQIDFEGGEGIARVPPVAAARGIIKTAWVPTAEAEKWGRAIGAAAILASNEAFPARSGLLQILSAPTAGHILRRLEEKGSSAQQFAAQLRTLKEVLG